MRRIRLAALAAAWILAPLAVALPATALAQGTVYVSSEKDDALTMIDHDTLALKGTVPTCKRGRHLQVTPDHKLMLACSESGVADLIDPATGKSLRHVPLGDDPEAFDLSPDGRTLYVSSEDDAAVVFIDVATAKRLREVKIGQEPEGVKVSADGKRLYVASEASNLVHVIDTGSGQVLKNIPVPKRPRRMAFAAGGKELWVTCELASTVAVISTTDNTVLATLKLEVKGARDQDITPVGIQASQDGKRVFVALGRANHVAFIDVASRKVTDLVLVGKRAWNLALDKSEQRLFVVNGLSDDLTVIDTASAKAIKTVPVGRVPYGVVVVE